MDWPENLNRAMDYIEEHLEGEISYDRAARLAGCSKYHRIVSRIPASKGTAGAQPNSPVILP